jgi:hypothetical protein
MHNERGVKMSKKEEAKVSLIMKEMKGLSQSLKSAKPEDLALTYKRIGVGTSRFVYSTPELPYVIKYAGSLKKGVAQNKTEYSTFNAYRKKISFLNPIYSISTGGCLLFMDKLKPIYPFSRKEHEAKLRSFGRRLHEIQMLFFNCVSEDGFLYEHLNESNVVCFLEGVYEEKTITKKQLDYAKSVFFQELCLLIFQCKLLIGDIFRLESWGVNQKGQIRILDYGLTVDTYRKYYYRRKIVMRMK